MYPDIIKEHFTKPRNVGILKNPTSIGEAITNGGGKAVFYFLIENGVVNKIKYKVSGCPYAIAVCSILSVYSRGRTVKELKNLKADSIKSLSFIPEDKLKCVELAFSAFKNGLI